MAFLLICLYISDLNIVTSRLVLGVVSRRLRGKYCTRRRASAVFSNFKHSQNGILGGELGV